ncbi:MAG: hypothetical protein ABSA83_07220 [Verrucomicrobiota bacterium]|jgi:tRNA U54 and U55 pseudouridine synthase Pus10
MNNQLLDEGLLSILDTNRTRYGLNAAALVFRLRLEKQITAKAEEITGRLEYLAARTPALVEEVRPEINRQNRVWKITAEGMRYTDEHNL